MSPNRFTGKFNVATMQNDLLLPPEFTHMADEIGDMVTIRRSNTYALWECHVRRQRRASDGKVTGIRIASGWKKAVEENEVEDGDYLYFEYHDNSVFTMFVIGSDYISKELDNLVGDNSVGRFRDVRNMRVLIMHAENSFAATLYMTRSSKEAFMVPISDDIIKDGFVEIPYSFVKRNLIHEGVTTTVPVVLEVQEQQTIVALKYIRKGEDLKSCIINSSFREFVIRHNCNGHGVFVFELESPFDPMVMKVSIFQM